ncbi:hypothetical protein [Methylobacterium sp.]|uniref:hypothetical protein n=1 Tax=Methylobacterium sp. TaxID=409 RepID=UPI0025EA7CBB|nr:hypothetical protein [Methylobacterium sp.]MBY0260140.1 hypothetical protein [Methylobacterium sp.]
MRRTRICELGRSKRETKALTFAEQAAELHQIEAVALSLGLSKDAFEQIALEVTAEAWTAGVLTPEY